MQVESRDLAEAVKLLQQEQDQSQRKTVDERDQLMFKMAQMTECLRKKADQSREQFFTYKADVVNSIKEAQERAEKAKL